MSGKKRLFGTGYFVIFRGRDVYPKCRTTSLTPGASYQILKENANTFVVLNDNGRRTTAMKQFFTLPNLDIS
jgi:hypothetical protein